MTPTILDAHALLVYLQKEQAYDTVRELFVSAVEENTKLLITVVNLGEVFYKTLRQHDAAKLRDVEALIGELPLEAVAADLDLAREAAFFKATKKMSFADCFAAALAKVRGGRVVTGDREFEQVEGEVEMLWL